MKGKEIRTVVYIPVVLDIFHYGHLQSLKFASKQGDYFICGILTDRAAKFWKKKLTMSFNERKAILSSLNFIDEVMVQNDIEPAKNLERIHKRFKNAVLILVHGDDWRSASGAEYLKRIGGRLVTHPYYTKLSDFRIINSLIERYQDRFHSLEEFVRYFKLKDFTDHNPRKLAGTVFVSKADTLKFLKPLLKKSIIEDMLVFTVIDWKEERTDLIRKIAKQFSPSKIVIRSSAINEDAAETSMAGYFQSELDVPSNNSKMIQDAVEKVIGSYKDKDSEYMINQVLVQKQTQNVALSGVVFTRTIENHPYYVINYDESGRTDSVTKGTGGKTVKISRFCNKFPEKFKRLMDSVMEIESIIQDSLDIEFATDKKNNVMIFQVRPLATSKKTIVDDEVIKRRVEELKNRFVELSKKSHLAGAANCFGDMPDWNPAEIIGDNPNFLDYSLYDYIITDSAWHEARTSQGYTNVSPAKLVVLFGNKPYVNVRNTFNSFTPAGISQKLREKLVNFYIKKLKNNPELQDKVEFEILHTCYDFSFGPRSNELLDSGFTRNEVMELKEKLIELTNSLVKSSKNSIWRDLNEVFSMDIARQDAKDQTKSSKNTKLLLKCAKRLLDDCRKNGTVQFSRLARLAFIGKIMLKSLVNEKTIDKKFYDDFLKSINTVATIMGTDFNNFLAGKVSKEEFFKAYGHLRPGTYDITSLRYDKNPSLLANAGNIKAIAEKKSGFNVSKRTEDEITKSLRKHGLKFDSGQFLEFARSSIEARELSKFEFTKSLSDAIELIAEAGKSLGFSRSDLAYLDTDFLLNLSLSEKAIANRWASEITKRAKEREINDCILLPPVIFSEDDFDVITYYSPRPNFITQKKVESALAYIDSHHNKDIDLKGRIVLLENGDPGYDWIFTKQPSGLITKYGGVASHMSIRSAEFGLPAAIGCGEIFDKLKSCRSVVLDCRLKKIIILDQE